MRPTATQAAVTSMLSSHLLGPLFLEYEAHSRLLERELRAKTQEVARQAEEMRALARENEEVTQRMEVQQREYMKMVEETRDHADLLVMRNGNGGQEGGDEVRELRQRIHLLTEENHSLFEQVTLLRAHFDSFNRDCSAQLEEATAKSAAFDLLHAQVSQLISERDRLLAQKLETERRLEETLRVAASVEEERRGE